MPGLLQRLLAPQPFLAVELRPPRADLEGGMSMDSWFVMNRAVRRLASVDTALFLTDNAVGVKEEENLHHLATNLEPDVSRERIAPFLTAKHSLEYCLWYADRAAEEGYEALTVLGGDRRVGPERCVPHAYLLRQRIRERHPELKLGGWANPQRDPAAQTGYLVREDAALDFYLTQIVSHHDLDPVSRFLEEADRGGLRAPGLFGVFYYRSANPRTLARLAESIPVPAAGVTREFESGASADEICARTIRALFSLGVRAVYVSNLRPEEADKRLAAIEALVR